ncbi:MAG: bifunctional 3-deoxy-7-phosphoheptulonate synthase/chorismate mutase type II [Rikenellaceae bacterium]|nr:bifunctional 3-deoxy-7-phosphoheptulonate synthase/chorismate mutase type II [Rikenellaceae bacterium]
MTAFDIKSKKPLIISGPCSAETEEQTLETCKQLAASGMVDVLRAGIWKPRTKPGNFEGVGIKGLPWMAKAKEITGLPIAIEVATGKHVHEALEFGVDILWVGARSTVNPFSVQEICDAVRGQDVTILIKNPMNPDVDLWIGAVERFRAVGVEKIGLIHRGFSAIGGKYRNNPMWHLAIEMRRRMPGLPLICDPSHICGRRDTLLEVCQKSADLNYDGLIIESHICPDKAWSDASQQVTPTDLETILKSIKWRNEIVDKPEFLQALDQFRVQIDQLDNELFELLSKRMNIAERIGEVKRDNNVTILQSGRWADIVERIVSQADSLKLSREFMSTILEAIHIESINRQNKIMNKK